MRIEPVRPGERVEWAPSRACQALQGILAINEETKRVEKILAYQIDEAGKLAWQKEIDKLQTQREKLVEEYKLARELEVE